MDSKYVDVHSHAYEYGYNSLAELLSKLDIVVVAVSDDYASSMKVLELSSRLDQVIPCIGVHPWTVNEVGEAEALSQAKRIVEIALEYKVRCLGEIGLDTKFVPESIEAQRRVLRFFLEAARDYGFRVNLHTAGTWREVFDLAVRYDIKYANFHWYTGPRDLLKHIAEHDFTISINPAIKIQRKHREIVAEAPLEIMLTESDAPYRYKGMVLSPELVPEVVKEIALIKNLDEAYVKNTIYKNFVKRWMG